MKTKLRRVNYQTINYLFEKLYLSEIIIIRRFQVECFCNPGQILANLCKDRVPVTYIEEDLKLSHCTV